MRYLAGLALAATAFAQQAGKFELLAKFQQEP